MNQSNIVLITLYYPTNSYFHKYYSYINKWNKFIIDFSKKNNYGLIDLSKILYNSNDFSYKIEPSSIGGKKICLEISKYIN